MESSYKTILLVEDEVIIALMEKSWLAAEGYKVIHAFSGLEAIEIVKKDSERINLILMDIDLGAGIDGTETALEILKTYDIPILFLSSHTEKEIVAKTEKITSYGYVVKDTIGTVLFASIKMAFKLHEAKIKLKTKEEELHKSKSDYQSLFENMTSGFALHKIIYDESGKPKDFVYSDANPSFEKIAGTHLKSFIGKTIKEVQPEIGQFWLDKYREVAETGNAASITNYPIGNNKFFDSWLFSPKQGEVAAIFTDVTNRKLAESALQKRLIALTSPIETSAGFGFEELFNIQEIQKIQDAFAEATGVASLITDPNGVPITNPSNFCELCSDIIRKTKKGLENCFYSDKEICNINGTKPTFQRCLSCGLWDGGTTISIGNRPIAKWLVGQVIDNSFDLDVIQNYADEIGVDKAVFRKALDKVPKMSKEKFETICNALSLIANQLSNLAVQNVQQARFITDKQMALNQLEISERKVNKINIELSELNKTKDRLFSIIGHDLKGPFSGFLGLTENLAKNISSLSSEEIQKYASVMHISANKLYELISNLFEWAKIQSGNMDIKPEILSVNSAVENVFGLFSKVSKAKSISLINNNLDNLKVFADSYMFLSVLRNLIFNAIKFSFPNGQIKVTSNKKDNFVSICVEDTGVGIETKDLEKIFQVDSGFSSKGTNGEEGSGLGLVLCKNMIEKNGGTIQIDSAIGKGTKVIISLPEAV